MLIGFSYDVEPDLLPFHTVAELFDRRCLLLCKTLPSRKTFFQDAQALTKYFFYESWDHLLIAMVKKLELEDPVG